MTSEDLTGDDASSQTARTVGQLVKYSREVNGADTVDEVATYTMEATYHVVDGNPSPTVVEIRGGELHVLGGMGTGAGGDADLDPLADRAYRESRTLIVPGAGTDVAYSEGADVVEGDGETTAVAVPSVFTDETGESGVVLIARWAGLERVEEHHVKPIEYLGDHVATAVTNIRARERLERARTDLAKRKETIEVYDRLLRHDLGNDLQVITSLSNALVEELDGDHAEYLERIRDTAAKASDLIDRVGGVVRTLEQEEERTARDLRPIVEEAVAEVDTKFDDLTVEVDLGGAGGAVYAGDLLGSIFTNVLSNAAVHNDGPVTVEVSAAEPSPGTVEVIFADDGAGVPEGVRDGIFEMGRKGPDSDGTGFGLGLARTLAESYGGTVEVGDSHLGGAAFRVRLQRP